MPATNWVACPEVCLSERRSGARIVVVNTKAHNPNAHIVLSIVAALRADSRVEEVLLCGYDRVVGEAQRGCDLLLALDGEAAQAELLYRAAAVSKRSALWSWEDPYETKAIQRLAPLFDHVFTNDAGSVSSYDRSSFLPLAAASLTDARSIRSEDSFDYDVSFVGSAWPSRIRFIRSLMKMRPSLRWKLALSFNPHVPNGYVDAPESDFRQSPSHFEFIEIANRSRVVLSIHRDFVGEGDNVAAANPGPRVFEVALAGGFQIVDRREGNVGNFFNESEVATFSSVEECALEIDRALADPDRRLKKVRAAQVRTAQQHLYEHRATTLLDEMFSRAPRSLVTPVNSRRRMLFVTHNIVSAGGFGGVEVYQDLIAAKLREVYDVFFYYPDRSSASDGSRSYILTDADGRFLRINPVSDFEPNYTLWTSEVDQAFASVLEEYSIELVHFHHVIEHTVSLPIIARSLGVPTVYTLQDFYLVCHRYNLLDHKGRFCRINERPRTETCDVCLFEAEGRVAGSQDYRRAWMQDVISSLDALIANTESSLQIFSGVYPVISQQLKSAVVGLPAPASYINPVVLTQDRRRPALRVAFLGNFSTNKGAELFLQVVKQLAHEEVEFSIFGRIDPPFEELLKTEAIGNLTVHGTYKPGRLDLSDHHVSLHLSNWPETYCIALSEAWAAGLVPIVTDIGALGERVVNGLNGYTVPVDGYGELLKLLIELIHDRSKIEMLRRNIDARLWTSLETHVSELIPIYEDLLKARPLPARRTLPPRSGADLDMEILDRAAGSPRWDRPDHVRNAILPSSLFPRLSPVPARLIEAVNGSLKAGRATTALSARLLHAQYGPYFAFSGSRLEALRPRLKGRFRVSGHVQIPLSENVGPRVLALRAADDLILRHIEEVALPMVLDAVPGIDIHFVSEPLSLELLEPRPYSVEIAALHDRYPQFFSLGFTLFGGEEPAFVAEGRKGGRSAAPRTALPATFSPAAVDENLCLDCSVELVALPSISAFYIRALVSPTQSTCARGGALTLRLDGDGHAFEAPFVAEGPAHRVNRLLHAGDRMACAVWLSGIPAGVYALSVRHDTPDVLHWLNASIEVDEDGCGKVVRGR